MFTEFVDVILLPLDEFQTKLNGKYYKEAHSSYQFHLLLLLKCMIDKQTVSFQFNKDQFLKSL